MTETTVTMCDALEASPLDPGRQLACFLRPHPDDPWHYDNRGLGVWFRAVPGGIDARLGLTARPGEAPTAEQVADLPRDARGAARDAKAERADLLDASNLPMLFATAGQLDVDRLRTLAPEVRTGLVAALRAEAAELRAGRGTVVVPEDTFDLVRRVTAAEEVLRQWAQAFTAAAAECVAIAEEEALTANGSYPGVEDAPSGSLFVPDGAGQRIAVTPDWKPGDSTWDVDTLAAWIAEDTAIGENGLDPNDEERLFTASEAVSLVRDGIDRLLALGTFSPSIKKLDALRKRLSERQRDSDAAIIRQVRSVGPRAYKGVKITREDVQQ